MWARRYCFRTSVRYSPRVLDAGVGQEGVLRVEKGPGWTRNGIRLQGEPDLKQGVPMGSAPGILGFQVDS